MKKLIVFLILFIGLWISQAKADTNISTLEYSNSIFKDYWDKKRHIWVKTSWAIAIVYDENGVEITRLTYKTSWSTSGYGYPSFIELLNGNILMIINPYKAPESTITMHFVLYDHITDTLHASQYTSAWNWSWCPVNSYSALADNKLIVQAYLTEGWDCSESKSWFSWGMYQVDLSLTPTDTGFFTSYTGNLVIGDLMRLWHSSLYSKITDNELIYKSANLLIWKQCSEDFGWLCDNIERLNAGTGAIINWFTILWNWIDMSSFSTVYTDENTEIQFYSNFIFNWINEFNDKYIQYYDYNSNIIYWVDKAILTDLEFAPNLWVNLNIWIVNYNDNAYYLYRNWNTIYLHTTADLYDDSITIWSVWGGEVWTGTTLIEYDESIWDFDLDGDGEVWLLNWEIFSAIWNMFKYLFDSLMNFFANIKALVEKLNWIFTTEVKTFSFMPWVNAYDNWLTNALNSIGGEWYEETFLWKFDGFIRAFVYFFVFIVWIVVFISINKNKNG